MLLDDFVEIPRMLMTRERLAWLKRVENRFMLPFLIVSIWLLFNPVGMSGSGPIATVNIALEFLRLAYVFGWNYIMLVNHWYGYGRRIYLSERIIGLGAAFSVALLTIMGAVNFVSNCSYHLRNIGTHPWVMVLWVVAIVGAFKIVFAIKQTLPLICTDYQNWQTYNCWASIKKTFQELYNIAPQ